MPDSAQMMQIIMPICGLADPTQWPNSCNLNLYEAVFEEDLDGHGMKHPKIWYRWDWVHSHRIFSWSLDSLDPSHWKISSQQDGGMSVGWHSDDESLFQGKLATWHDVRKNNEMQNMFDEKSSRVDISLLNSCFFVSGGSV